MEPYTVSIAPSIPLFNPHLIADADEAEQRARLSLQPRGETLEDRVRQLEVRLSWLERRTERLG